MVGLSHAEYMARRAPQGVANHNETAGQHAVTNDAGLTVVLACIYDLDGGAFEHDRRVLEVQTTFGQRLGALDGVEGNAERLL
jgi:hypothetical protein